jgi:hypothetical protein
MQLLEVSGAARPICGTLGLKRLMCSSSSVTPGKTSTIAYNKTPTRCTDFPNLFCYEALRVSSSSYTHHPEFIHCTLSNGISHTGLWTAFEQNHMLLLDSCLQTCTTYTIAGCTVNKLRMMDRRTVRNM